MADIITVRFKDAGKAYTFDPGSETYAKDEQVIVETVHGLALGTVATGNRPASAEESDRQLRRVVRRATEKDLQTIEANRKKEAAAFAFCNKRVDALKLDMQLVEVECSLDGGKMLFYFTSDDRVDFRELVKNLAAEYHTRIAMRQIGVRDVSKMVGGLGICGRPFCCATYMKSFHPVSIKMAKEQGLSLNPGKISGTCGRLLCCLKYEQETYEHLNKITPRVGALVDGPEGRGRVTEANLITGRVKVCLDRRPEALPAEYDRSELKVIPTTRTPKEQ